MKNPQITRLAICIILASYFFAGEFQHAINLSRPKLIFASKIVLNTVLKVSKQNTFVQKVILLDSVQDNRIVNNKLVITLSDLVSSVNVSKQLFFFVMFGRCRILK